MYIPLYAANISFRNISIKYPMYIYFVKFLYKSYDSCLCFKRGLNFFNLLKRKKKSALNNFNKSYRSSQFYRELV